MNTPLSVFFETRPPVREAFLKEQGCDDGAITPIGEDWGTRRYFRVDARGQSFILMESVPDHMPFAAPGHRVADFIRLSSALNDAGLHAPAIIAADVAEGFVLMEDMGDQSFSNAMSAGGTEKHLYRLATDVLVHMAKMTKVDGLPLYTASHVHKGRRRVIDWYAPVMRGQVNPDGWAEEYLSVWDDIEKSLPPCPQGFVHGDYHVQNLMLCPEEQGLRRCGILDFQGAMEGPLPYDLANLLGDIRRDVPHDIEDAMINYRTSGMDAAARDNFMAWYVILKIQFHCRVIGQVIRLGTMGKPAHLRHMPRLQRFVNEGLSQPLLAPLQRWFAEKGIIFDGRLAADPAAPGSLIRPDAF